MSSKQQCNQMKRQWLVSEKNHLLAHGFNLNNLDQYQHKPVEYITGCAQFRGVDFAVNQHTLIPRVETEQLVDLIISDINFRFDPDDRLVIADIGTGCGAIGLSLMLALAKSNYRLNLYLSDVSQKALAAARSNWQKISNQLDNKQTSSNGNLQNRYAVKFIHSDLLDSYSEKKIDVIVANLPYIPTHKLSTLPLSVKEYEPISALDGGVDGLQYVKRLVKQAPLFLTNSGKLWLEIDQDADLNWLRNISNVQVVLHRDYRGKQRFLEIDFE